MGDVAEAKRKAAYAAVDENVTDGMIVGIGSGSTIVFGVERLAQRVHKEGLNIKCCVPSSFQAIDLIQKHDLPLSDLNRNPEIDVYIDGADECDAELNCIKGGGGANTQEKLCCFASKKFVVVADYTKRSQILGEKWKKGVPVEVLANARVMLGRKFEAMGGKPVLRMAKAKAGPVITDNGHMILDVDFGEIKDPAALEAKIAPLPGVITTGLFIRMAERAYFGNADGSVAMVTPASV
eukprot:Clim_evm42s230 gene=Clim_evmTU42s230